MVRRWLGALLSAWRRLLTSPAVRRLEEVGPEAAAHQTLAPLPPPAGPDAARLRDAEERLRRLREEERRLEERMDELADLYGRARREENGR